LRILCDPWWEAAAYNNQWLPWPTPKPDGVDKRPTDYIYISHGHEDHLNLETLATLRPGAIALTPRFATGRLAPFLESLKMFREVLELDHGRTIRLGSDVRATCYVNATDSMLVLEGDETIVNANDALHASPRVVIDYFCRSLQRRHPNIDAMFIGYGGAAWVPNCIRLPGKNDRAVARIQERSFVDNFLRIVDRLRPHVACAFAASFVLLEPWNRWINEVRFEVPTPDIEYARQPNGKTMCHLLLPNDIVERHVLTRSDTPRPRLQDLERAYRAELSAGCRHAADQKPLSESEVRDLAEKIERRLKFSRGWSPRRARLHAQLAIRDNPGGAFQVRIDAAKVSVVWGPRVDVTPELTFRAEVVRAVLDQEYGSESVFIGYGAVANLRESKELATATRLIQLLSPRTGGIAAVAQELTRQPFATARTLWRQRASLGRYLFLRLGLLSSQEQVLRG